MDRRMTRHHAAMDGWTIRLWTNGKATSLSAAAAVAAGDFVPTRCGGAMDAKLPGGSVDQSEDYSPTATVVRFDPPLPLLRAPVPSSSASGEPPVLAFRDAASWRAAWEAAEASLLSQCEAGARAGCSVTASRKCKPPWWKGLLGRTPTDYQERERCEEREMASCLEAAREACVKFAKEKCIEPFRDARIASEGLLENTNFTVWGVGTNITSSASLCIANREFPFKPCPGATNYKGSDLLDSLSSEDNNIKDDD